MKVINYIVLIISIIGCVNWGLIGLFDFNLVDMLFGTGSGRYLWYLSAFLLLQSEQREIGKNTAFCSLQKAFSFCAVIH